MLGQEWLTICLTIAHQHPKRLKDQFDHEREIELPGTSMRRTGPGELIKPERLLARVEVGFIDVGIFLEKRRIVLEEMDRVDNGSRGKPLIRNLKQKAGRLEMQILRLEDAIRRDHARLASLLSRD